jgi:hypothetical protein
VNCRSPPLINADYPYSALRHMGGGPLPRTSRSIAPPITGNGGSFAQIRKHSVALRDGLPVRLPAVDVSVSLGDLLQGIAPVDDRPEFSHRGQFPDYGQVVGMLFRALVRV